ncbi:hypothetical protein NC652_040434 [Populus alba x Populus x berolinensis]|nr:hypothetical protein NC652_040434 [Populus alba x Populus x berolinensis]
MKEIIGGTRSDEEGVMGEESSTSTSTNTELKLPKLVFMVLKELPELKSICNAKLICNSLEVIEADTCEKLKRTAIYLENGQPSTPLEEITVYLEEWWEPVVEWEHPNAKDILCQSILQRRLWPTRSQVASMLKGRTPVPELLSDPGTRVSAARRKGMNGIDRTKTQMEHGMMLILPAWLLLDCLSCSPSRVPSSKRLAHKRLILSFAMEPRKNIVHMKQLNSMNPGTSNQVNQDNPFTVMISSMSKDCR